MAPRKLSWVIIGGENGSLDKVRLFVIEHAYDLKQQCQESSIAVFIKQLGRLSTLGGKRLKLSDKKGEDLREWPDDLCVQQYSPYLADTGFPLTLPSAPAPVARTNN